MITHRLIRLTCLSAALVMAQTGPPRIVVLHAARLLDVEGGRMLTPGELLVEGDRIREVGASVRHPTGAETVDLGKFCRG